MNIMNTIFMTIPIVFDYPTLGLITKDEKQEFVDTFLKDVINIPITKTINNGTEDIVIGIITEGEQVEDFNVHLYAMGLANIGADFIQLPSTEENADLPMGKRVQVSSIHFDFENKQNKRFFDITQKQREIADKIKNITNLEINTDKDD